MPWDTPISNIEGHAIYNVQEKERIALNERSQLFLLVPEMPWCVLTSDRYPHLRPLIFSAESHCSNTSIQVGYEKGWWSRVGELTPTHPLYPTRQETHCWSAPELNPPQDIEHRSVPLHIPNSSHPSISSYLVVVELPCFAPFAPIAIGASWLFKVSSVCSFYSLRVLRMHNMKGVKSAIRNNHFPFIPLLLSAK